MENIVIHGFCNVTQRLSSIRLEPEEGIILTKEPVYSGTIRLHGFLDGEMLFLIPEEMAEQIVFQMSHGRPMSEAEWDGYFKEYLNIVAGCMISQIGNFFGKRVRFSLPMVKKGVCKEITENEFQFCSRHDFSNELGIVHFVFRYNEVVLEGA